MKRKEKGRMKESILNFGKIKNERVEFVKRKTKVEKQNSGEKKSIKTMKIEKEKPRTKERNTFGGKERINNEIKMTGEKKEEGEGINRKKKSTDFRNKE